TEMIVWGGVSSSAFNTGGRYNPSTDSWTATSTTNAPDARFFHTAVSLGGGMILWGGTFDGGPTFFDTGGRYNSGSDSWTATTTNNAPTARERHTAVSTDIEMIVWGGDEGLPRILDTGARYDPGSDSWTATSTISAPEARTLHTAVWTGREMIIWGGGTVGGRLNTGWTKRAQSNTPTPTPTITSTPSPK